MKQSNTITISGVGKDRMSLRIYRVWLTGLSHMDPSVQQALLQLIYSPFVAHHHVDFVSLLGWLGIVLGTGLVPSGHSPLFYGSEPQ